MSCKNVMQDCRAFTDYTPNCQLNEYFKFKYAPGSSSEYRMWLQRNACKNFLDIPTCTDFTKAKLSSL